ncbi:hypothetical protein BDU57DRAFT_575886 [Ampelomyces quisqualis]|uniref:DUF7587 domain-containing protein n=1 Tax=Ampelomyces quisqualis TaxID=50730 RepID=A0A6A5QP28_AMPQU|nr:hypothetical protein BDU57DRAFT_575886 [Ampelomyces quisqualis]
MTTIYNHPVPSPSFLPAPTSPSSTSTTSTTSDVPACVPHYVYRVHHPSAQTKYSFGAGFSSKNHSTIIPELAIADRFGLAHLHGATNISSPLISVVATLGQAERLAACVAAKFPDEDVSVVKIDTAHFARGPVWRAEYMLQREGKGREKEWAHEGEYLVTYWVPGQAIVSETVVCRGKGGKRGSIGVIGGEARKGSVAGTGVGVVGRW